MVDVGHLNVEHNDDSFISIYGDIYDGFSRKSLRSKKFTGVIVKADVGKDVGGFYSRVRADKGQGMVVDENFVYNSELKRR